MKIAICVVTYNRLNTFLRLLDSILSAAYDSNNQYDLIISIDYSGNSEIYDHCKNIKWNNGGLLIKRHDVNLGLKKHILMCGDYVKDYDGIVLLEDDLIVSKYYTDYIMQVYPICLLPEYGKIAGISLYTYECNEFSDFRTFCPRKNQNDIYLMKIPSSWGQFWTKKQWSDFKRWLMVYEGRNDFNVPNVVKNWGQKSWKKLFSYYMEENGLYFIYPYYAYSTNMSEAGQHNIRFSNVMQCKLMEDKIKIQLSHDFDNYIRYDQFMENENIKKHYKNTTIDIYGTKHYYDRFLITSKKENYKVIKSWGTRIKPLELNIEKNIPGNSLFLYDTYITEKNTRKDSIDEFMLFYPFTKNVMKKYIKLTIRFCIERIKRIGF